MAQVSPQNEGFRLLSRYLVLALVAAIFLFPLIFMMVSSLKPDAQLLSDTSSFRAFLPVGDVSLENYFAAFERAPIGRFMLNSVFVTITTVVLSIAICSIAAFSFVFLEWTGRNILLSVILATLIIPFETIAVPLLLLVSRLPWLGLEGMEWGWLNTYRVQIIPWVVDALTVFLFVQYFKDLPRELIEAARAEGASWLQIYRRVVMPLSGPVLATAAILKSLKMYNEQYLWPLIVVQDESHRPIMVGLGYFFQLDVAWGELMAYLTLISIPVLLFYLIMQRAFIASIASTGVKG
ncbi:carbohydrate ABC transporter membrane protein 2, CUT1 family [Cohaesibacter sp. ES.047]|uniref:carbohydrate ABC transporter permease n=1 Tax=Cohaesibacter sp. ES.047 TaxID=1798205 RepID=UPI000BB88108|nr:carbohydrate ABC transporter permease [Cohaesibacter sp. ES.047]SNY93353.1 carbohydrate ABC transporter membrane protein 2, CUT1 family [Cohaesibacter sp. ES.047]